MGETKVCINDPGHMTKMATRAINSKNLKKSSGPISMKLGMYHRGRLPIIVCINHDLGLTLTYFTARSILVT